jgi:OmpA-OmpF porin, OOP family
MKRFVAALALVLVVAWMTGAAEAKVKRGATHDKTDADHIICKMTHPWPFGCDHDSSGPADTDGDGIADRSDKCPGTPRNAMVDDNGCPMDTDHDGVADGIDKCDGTPAGTMVDATGCPQDSDKDGVFDGADKCPDTPRIATVDASGCPADADQDGVFDGIDKCPGTSAEWAVDQAGCPIPVSETYQEFLDAKSVSAAIEFDSGKSTLKPSSEEILNRVGEVLNDWPEAKVEIGGHTDAQGSTQVNKTLSESRARSVKDWLTSHYANIDPDNLNPRGYGESKPVASNDTAEGRAQNRRVTFTLTNADDLDKDIETRRYKKRGER